MKSHNENIQINDINVSKIKYGSHYQSLESIKHQSLLGMDFVKKV